MNTWKTICLSIMLVIFTSSCGANQDIPDVFNVTLSVKADNIANKSASPIEVTGNPVFIEVSMSTKDDSPGAGFYVHLIQKESGAGIKYYYQGSTGFFNKSTNSIPVWLGGETGTNKYYQIYGIVSRTEQYEKNSKGIKEFDTLPGNPVSMLNVKRVR